MKKKNIKKNIIEKFLSGDKGKRFFNFAYSIGAAIVILGALFKILHLPGGSIMLSVGMGVEVLMFCLSAFEKPQKEYKWEEVFPVLDSKDPSDRPEFKGGGGTYIVGGGSPYTGELSSDGVPNIGETPSGGVPYTGPIPSGGVTYTGPIPSGGVTYTGPIPSGGVPYSGTVGGGDAVAPVDMSSVTPPSNPEAPAASSGDTAILTQCVQQLTLAIQQLSGDEPTATSQQQAEVLTAISEQMGEMAAATRQLTEVSTSLLEAITASGEKPSGDDAADNSSVLENMSRNISGLNAIYATQLRSATSQLSSLEQVNNSLAAMRDMYDQTVANSIHAKEQAARMAQQMAQLNGVYERMLSAMTLNMYGHNPHPYQGMPNQQHPRMDNQQQPY